MLLANRCPMSENRHDDLTTLIRQFTSDRDWQQFHSPKNLAMALVVEAAELVEQFQWLTETESRDLGADKMESVGQEIGDIYIYLLRLADELGLDLDECAERKIAINQQKYPIKNVRGSAKKYNEY